MWGNSRIVDGSKHDDPAGDIGQVDTREGATQNGSAIAVNDEVERRRARVWLVPFDDFGELRGVVTQVAMVEVDVSADSMGAEGRGEEGENRDEVHLARPASCAGLEWEKREMKCGYGRLRARRE